MGVQAMWREGNAMSRVELMVLWIAFVLFTGLFAEMGLIFVSASFATVAVALFVMAPFLVGEDQ